MPSLAPHGAVCLLPGAFSVVPDPTLKPHKLMGVCPVNYEAIVCHLDFFIHQTDTHTDSTHGITFDSFRSILLNVTTPTSNKVKACTPETQNNSVLLSTP